MVITYKEQEKKPQSYRKWEKSLITVKVERVVCRISNISMSVGDPRLCYFLVYGEKVPINGEEFLGYCKKMNWSVTKEEIYKNGCCFDIKQWLEKVEKKLNHNDNLTAGELQKFFSFYRMIMR